MSHLSNDEFFISNNLNDTWDSTDLSDLFDSLGSPWFSITKEVSNTILSVAVRHRRVFTDFLRPRLRNDAPESWRDRLVDAWRELKRFSSEDSPYVSDRVWFSGEEICFNEVSELFRASVIDLRRVRVISPLGARISVVFVDCSKSDFLGATVPVFDNEFILLVRNGLSEHELFSCIVDHIVNICVKLRVPLISDQVAVLKELEQSNRSCSVDICPYERLRHEIFLNPRPHHNKYTCDELFRIAHCNCLEPSSCCCGQSLLKECLANFREKVLQRMVAEHILLEEKDSTSGDSLYCPHIPTGEEFSAMILHRLYMDYEVANALIQSDRCDELLEELLRVHREIPLKCRHGSDQDFIELINADMQFHIELYRLAGAQKFLPILLQNMNRMYLKVPSFQYNERCVSIAHEHAGIIEAIRSHDSQFVFSSLRRHYLSSARCGYGEIFRELAQILPASLEDFSEYFQSSNH